MKIVVITTKTHRSQSRATFYKNFASLLTTSMSCDNFSPILTLKRDAKRLYDDLLSSYNRLIRPVFNNSDRLTVKMGLKLSQLIDVNLKNQIMTTNVWVNQHDSGKVEWNPPAIYKSSCNIDINYFPFDQQEPDKESVVDYGIDLSEFYINVEWDIMTVPAMKRIKYYSCCPEPYIDVTFNRIKYYSCCPEPYIDVTFNVTLRRKTLFYTVNLIIPCVGISCLSVLVFYLPSDSGEKVTLSVSIMLSLTFFFLVLIEIIPSTSLTMPLLGKYLVFTMVLVTCSVIVTILVLNIHFRSPSTHRMAPWVRRTFIRILPKLLLMRPPQYKLENIDSDTKPTNGKAATDMAN
ncbi:unnamed protein product, partial [Medioppia subpectinata]